MLAWVVIYRRHLQHSTPTPSSLRTLRLCVQLSRPDPARVTAHYCFKSFRRNTYGSPASVANKRLTARLSPLDATLTKNGGARPSNQILFLCPGPRSPVPASRLPYALPSSVSRNLFVCHSCENCRVCTNNSHSGTRPVCSPTHSLIPYPLSIPRLVVSCG